MIDRRDDYQLAIGTDPNNLATLKRMEIPIPDQRVYSPASLYYVRSDGSRVGDGYATATWVWDVISYEKLALLLEFLSGAEWANIYIKTDKRTGVYALPSEAYSVFYAIMWQPILAGQEGVPIARSQKTYQSVKVQFRILSEHSEYL